MANHNFIILFECKLRAIPCHALTIANMYALSLTDIIIFNVKLKHELPC